MAQVAVGIADGVLAEVHDLARGVIAPGAAAVDRESQLPDAQLKALGQVGALGLLVPREQGGSGAGLVASSRSTHPTPRPPLRPGSLIATSADTSNFGISNIKRSVSVDPDMVGPLVTAAEARAAKLVSLSGLSPVLVEALTIMTARSLQPADLSTAASDVRGLMETMERNRLRRRGACSFDAAIARHLSDLHTPNLM